MNANQIAGKVGKVANLAEEEKLSALFHVRGKKSA